MLASAAVRPSIPAYPRVSAQLQAMLEAVLTAQLTPAAAVAHAADMISAVTGLPVADRSRGLRRAAGCGSIHRNPIYLRRDDDGDGSRHRRLRLRRSGP
jgi:hypothetical protein